MTNLLILIIIATPEFESVGRYSNLIVVSTSFTLTRIKTVINENKISTCNSLNLFFYKQQLQYANCAVNLLLSIVCANFSNPSKFEFDGISNSASSFFSRHSWANCIELLIELHIDSSIVVPVFFYIKYKCQH